jgi:predicted ATPase
MSTSLPSITAVHFKNFRVLRKAILPLERFTLIVGPNGSGKSTAMLGLHALALINQTHFPFQTLATAGVQNDPSEMNVEISVAWSDVPWLTRCTWHRSGTAQLGVVGQPRSSVDDREWNLHLAMLTPFKMFSFDPLLLAMPVRLEPQIQLLPNGGNLAGVLDRLRDEAPETFRALNEEIGRCLPEFDQVVFDTPTTGTRTFLLRTRQGGHRIAAADLSHGTLFLVAILTLAHMVHPPPLLCIEDPDRGIHPRLLREIRDALYRLSHPERTGEDRDPVQVIATTHSPYLLDLYRDHPEEVVIAQKTADGAVFERLSDRTELFEVLKETHLGDAWYSGVLGGVPAD